MIIGGHWINEDTATQVGEWWVEKDQAYGPEGESWIVDDGVLTAEVGDDEENLGHGHMTYDSPTARGIPLDVLAKLIELSGVTP